MCQDDKNVYNLAVERRTIRRFLPKAVSGELLTRLIEAARLAPSARNRQPWRFRVQDSSIVVTEDGKPSLPGISKRLDCGIAMLHLELGARAAGTSGSWKLLNSPDVARFLI